ncbi:MAG: hypothetical protein ABI905_12955, partial [Betaproteobacteria bacterium]
NVLVTGYSSDVLGGTNARVLKYDSDGSLLWSAKYDGAFAGRDLATGVSMDAAGNVLISGVTAVSAANDNIFAAKFAGNTGAMMWSGVNPSAPLHTYASAMVAAADGTVAATGYAFFGSSGRGDMATVKYNSAGSILWSRLFQGTAVGISVGKAIAMDNTGNVVVTGVSADSTGGTNNIRTIKYDGGTGTELWNAVFNGGGTGVESGLAVAIDAAGNVAMTGYSNDAGNNQNMRTIKYDGSSGAVLWNAVYAGSGNGADTGNAIRFDSAGNLVVTGSSVDTVGTKNMRTIKYNGATGSELWNVNFAGTDTVSGSGDAGNAIAIDNADNVIVTGQSTDTAGLRNMRTIKYLGSTGVAIWNKSFNANGTSDDLATAIAVDANNNVVVTGSNSASGQGTNIRTIKYASQDGAELWNVTYNGDGGSGVSEDTGAAIAVDAAGHVYVNGYSTDAAGAKNMRLIKYDGATGNTKWTHVYAGSANADDTGLSVAIGPASSVYAFGNSNEIGKPLGWLLQRIEEITVPVAPIINSGMPGDQLAVINFTANGTGGSPILSYTAKCTNGGNTFSATGAVSPVSVTGLVNGVSYSCSVTATNAQGNSPASSPVTVTPSALPPLSLSAVVSTKTHGAAGPFNLPVDVSRKIYEAITVEPRAIGTGHIITFSFNNPVTSLGAVSAVDAAATTVGSASAVISGKDIVVTLTGIPDRKRIAVGLTGVNNVLNASASIGFLRGNSSQSGTVSDADVAAVKVRAAYVTNNTNYLFDINASGYINAADIAAVKVRKGGALQ